MNWDLYREASSWMNVKEELDDCDKDDEEGGVILDADAKREKVQQKFSKSSAKVQRKFSASSAKVQRKASTRRRLESRTDTTLPRPGTPAKAASGIGTLVSARSTRAFASPWLFFAWHSYEPKSEATRDAILRVERVVVGPRVKCATEWRPLLSNAFSIEPALNQLMDGPGKDSI